MGMIACGETIISNASWLGNGVIVVPGRTIYSRNSHFFLQKEFLNRLVAEMPDQTNVAIFIKARSNVAFFSPFTDTISEYSPGKKRLNGKNNAIY